MPQALLDDHARIAAALSLGCRQADAAGRVVEVASYLDGLGVPGNSPLRWSFQPLA